MALDQVDVDKLDETGKEMSFLDHLEALRWHLFRSAIAICVGGGIVFSFQDWVFANIILAPKSQDFITFKLLCKLGPNFCYTPPKFDLVTRELGEQFTESMYVGVWLGVILASPYILYEIWKFVKPGLYKKEQDAVSGIVLICAALFILGVCFGYFVLAPFSIAFLAGYTVGAINMPTLSSYISYMTMFTLPIGLVFELPVILFFMTKIGVITPSFLRKYRRHAVVLIVIAAGVITPPDVLSQLLVCFPLLLLYEVSILVCTREYKRKQKLAEASE
jgi:sec-independent protein translocase protein TatC